MKTYDNLVEGINDLRLQGYTEDFNLRNHCLECRGGMLQVYHDEFIIDTFYRFDYDSDPADQMILYAISSDKYKLKGILINPYGVYADEINSEMADSLRISART